MRKRQRKAIAAMAYGAMLAFAAAAAHAQSSGGSLRASATMRFQVVIPAIVRVKAFVQPAALEVAAQDVARGYVELDRASSLLLTSNSLQGCMLTVGFDTSVVVEVGVKLANEWQVVRASQGSVRVYAPRGIDAPVSIGYRLFLKRGVVPGVYPWPVNLAFSVAAV